MSDNTFTCEACGGTFEKGWTDEEAAERAGNGWDGTDCSVACHDCYLKIMERRGKAAEVLDVTPVQFDVLMGATDNSRALLEEWAAILQVPVKYLTKSREDA
jgi:hypothetical protein